MIVRENAKEFILIHQHDHATISGEICKEWADEFFLGGDQRSSVELAITNHDWCWQHLDTTPLYLEDVKRPASFVEHPLSEKITAYRSGVDFMEKKNKYAALLISQHYSSFFQGNVVPIGELFRHEEEGRQKRLVEELKNLSIDLANVMFHFDLLQLCDNLSLYLCMNEWGCDKESEIPWFRNSFPQRLTPFQGEQFQCHWKGDRKVQITPYPFKIKELSVSIPFFSFEKNNLTSQSSLIELHQTQEKNYHHVSFTC